MDRAARRRRLHMPGHFGAEPRDGDFLHWALDLTEVDGLDTLSAPSGVLRDLQDRFAAAYGAGAAWLSVQGATLPVMAGSLGWAGYGARVQIPRHAHRSVLAAAILGEWDVDWVPNPVDPTFGLPLPPPLGTWPRPQGEVTFRLSVSPTYEGVLAPVPKDEGVSLFVDAAHGGHFGRSTALPRHALTDGADLVAHGLHKTEPVLTQSGILLARSAHPDVDRWWRLLGTSSPSYLLLAGLEAYVRARESGDGGWGAYVQWAHQLWLAAERCGHIVLQAQMEASGAAVDPSKFTVGGDGPRMQRRLRKAGFEPEAVTAGSVTFVLGPALATGDALIQDILDALGPPTTPARFAALPDVPRKACSLVTAVRHPRRLVPLAEAAGLVAADPLTPYPPGIPVVMPGEILEADVLDYVEETLHADAVVEGVEPGERGWSVWVADV